MDSIRERLKNLLVLLLESLASESEEAWVDRTRFLHLASLAGFDEAEIHGLLDWVQTSWLRVADDRWDPEWGQDHAAGQGVRCFGAEEREFLTPPAFGHLLDLCQAGQISRQQMEALIHYASQVSVQPLGQQDIDQLLEQVVFSFGELDRDGFQAEGPGNVH